MAGSKYHFFSDYPIRVYNAMTWIGISKTKIERRTDGNFKLVTTSKLPFLIYWIFHLNSWTKGVFLLCFFAGVWDLEAEFFDYIAGLSWFLIFIETCIGDWLLMRMYPYYEVLTAGFKVTEEIMQKLGPRRQEFLAKQDRSAYLKVWFQWIVLSMGICACILQYHSAPKYVIFTNSLIKKDTTMVNFFMGFHDVGFIALAWFLYGANTAIQSVVGGQLQHSLRFLRREVEIMLQKDNSLLSLKEEAAVEPMKKIGIMEDYVIPEESPDFETEYKDIEEIIMDYRKLAFYTNQMNEFCKYNFLCMHVVAYVQMTCDVFAMFQTLRLPDSKASDVSYFIEDCAVCMYLLFKCFKAISFVKEECIVFHRSLREYIWKMKTIKRRKYLRRQVKALRQVDFRLGPIICSPTMVGNAGMTLMNYYILVALW